MCTPQVRCEQWSATMRWPPGGVYKVLCMNEALIGIELEKVILMNLSTGALAISPLLLECEQMINLKQTAQQEPWP